MYGVVIPNKYSDIIQPLIRSIHQKIPSPPKIIIIADGHENSYGFDKILYDDEHFCYSRAVNKGIRALPHDVILINDDTVILEWNFFDRLAQLAYAVPSCGLLSPLIVGCVGNPVQRYHEQKTYWKPDLDFANVKEPAPVCFPCVYIKRRVFEQVGLLKETFASYGYDDVNMCERIRKSGWKTMVTQRLLIQHGDGSAALGEGRGKSWATSYARRWEGGTPSAEEIIGFLDRHKGE